MFLSSRLVSSLLCCSSLKAAKAAIRPITSPITIMTAAIIANCVELNLLQTKIITPYYIFNHLYSANIRDVNNNMFLRLAHLNGGGEGSRTPVRNRIHKSFSGCSPCFKNSLNPTPMGRLWISVAFKIHHSSRLPL